MLGMEEGTAGAPLDNTAVKLPNYAGVSGLQEGPDPVALNQVRAR